MIEILIIPMVVSVFAGVILLVLEYKTSWFQNHLLKKHYEEANDFVNPWKEQRNPTADWVQISVGVQKWLEEIYCKSTTESKYVPSVQLEGIYPITIGKISFDVDESDVEMRFVVNDKFGKRFIANVLVRPTGKVVGSYTTPD